MTLLTAPDEPKTVASPRAGAPVLRLRSPDGADERTVTLSDGKWTVGSSPQCQVYLQSADVRPLQCVIVVEATIATVTRWATGVQLNGREFSKATLDDGDRLTVGDWTIEFGRKGEVTRPPADQSKGLAATSKPANPAIAPLPRTGEKAVDSRRTVAAVPLESQLLPGVSPGGAKAPDSGMQVFQDRLVLELWTDNYQARRRAKGLINGVRAARFQADAMAADLAAMEMELDLARAAYESHLGKDDRLQQELAELRRQDELHVASLNEEIVALRSQLDAAQAGLAQRTADYKKLAAEAASAQQMAGAAQFLSEHAPGEPPSDDMWRAGQPAEESAQETEQPPVAWDAFAPVANDALPSTYPLAATDPPHSPAAFEEPAPTSVAEVDQAVSEPSHACPAFESTPISSEPEVESSFKPAWSAPLQEPAAADASSTSFIDKYRHLLDEEGDVEPLPCAGGRPVIDEEFLSPAQAQTCADPADDSDEALEAYMANMMRRVRSSSGSFARDHAPPTDEPPASLASLIVQAAAAPARPAPATPEIDPLFDEPLSFEDLKLATRKVPLASDLTALREIANSTARAAISKYAQRRSRDSAITKLILAVTAMVSAAYLMASAPALHDWQFWTGAATCAVGVTSAIQVLILERRRRW
jgi:hypothetical protein